MSIDHLSKNKSAFNQQTTELIIPDILFHPGGKVVDETVKLLQDNSGDGSCFFVKISDEKLPVYFSIDQELIFQPSFMNQFESEKKELQDNLATKD